jgi:hypothetical protein
LLEDGQFFFERYLNTVVIEKKTCDMSKLHDIYLLLIALDKYFLQYQLEELLVFPEV